MKKTFDRNLLLAGLFALAMAVILSLQGKALKLPETTGGILSLEFAQTTQRVEEILQAWKHLSNIALWNILLDYVFMLAYGLFFFRSMKHLLAYSGAKLNSKSNLLLRIAWLPSKLDFIENGFMLGWLLHFIPSFTPSLVYYLVIFKFSMAALLLLLSLPLWAMNIFAPRVKK